MTDQDKATVLKHILGQVISEHPLPWTVEHDWTNEVVASDRTIIVKCHNEDEAKMIIAAAEELQAEIDNTEKENEEFVNKLLNI